MNLSELKDAGFNEQEIGEYVSAKRTSLLDAGFADREVNDYFGIDGNTPEFAGVPDSNVASDRAGKIWDKGMELGVPSNTVRDNYDEMMGTKDPDEPPDITPQKWQGMQIGPAPEHSDLMQSVFGYESLAKPDYYWQMNPIKRAAFDFYMAGRHLLTRTGGKVATQIGVANTKDVHDLYNDELVSNPKWYQKSPEATGWVAEQAMEYYALKGLWKATGLHKAFGWMGQKLAQPFLDKAITIRGGVEVLPVLSKEGLKMLGKDAVASFLRFAPENTAFLATWAGVDATLTDEDKTEAVWAGSLWGLGLTALTSVTGPAGKVFMATGAGKKLQVVASEAYTNLWQNYPRLMNAGRKPFSDEFMAEAKRQFKARFGVEPTAVDEAQLSKLTRMVGDEITKTAQKDAAIDAYWNSGKEAAQEAAKPAVELPATIGQERAQPAKIEVVEAKTVDYAPPEVKPTGEAATKVETTIAKTFEDWTNKLTDRNKAAIREYTQTGNFDSALREWKNAGEGLYGGDRRAENAVKIIIETAKARPDYPLTQKGTPNAKVQGQEETPQMTPTPAQATDALSGDMKSGRIQSMADETAARNNIAPQNTAEAGKGKKPTNNIPSEAELQTILNATAGNRESYGDTLRYWKTRTGSGSNILKYNEIVNAKEAIVKDMVNEAKKNKWNWGIIPSDEPVLRDTNKPDGVLYIDTPKGQISFHVNPLNWGFRIGAEDGEIYGKPELFYKGEWSKKHNTAEILDEIYKPTKQSSFNQSASTEGGKPSPPAEKQPWEMSKEEIITLQPKETKELRDNAVRAILTETGADATKRDASGFLQDVHKVAQYYADKLGVKPLTTMHERTNPPEMPYGGMKSKNTKKDGSGEWQFLLVITPKMEARSDWPLMVRHEIEHAADAMSGYIGKENFYDKAGKLQAQGHHKKYPTNFNVEYAHEVAVKQALSEGKPVPKSVLAEYKGEPWADAALAKTEQPPAKAGEGVKGQQKLPEQQKGVDEFVDNIKKPKRVRGKLEPGMVDVSGVTEAVKEVVSNGIEYAKETYETAKDAVDALKFYPDVPMELRNAIRTDIIGAGNQAGHNIYGKLSPILMGKLSGEDIEKAAQIFYAKDEIARTKAGKGNPDLSLEDAQTAYDELVNGASPEVLKLVENISKVQKTYTDVLVERGLIDADNLMEDYARHYVTDYTPEWAFRRGLPPLKLRTPFRGYTKKAKGTTKEYHRTMESILFSFYEKELDNIVADFIEEQTAKYNILPTLSREKKIELFGKNERGTPNKPKPGRIIDIDGKRYKSYSPDAPFARTFYRTEDGEMAMGGLKHISVIPIEIANAFNEFSQRGNAIVAKINQVTRFWKSMAILSHYTGFTLNNLIGDTYAALMQHPEPTKLLAEYTTALNYLTGKGKGQFYKDLEKFIMENDVVKGMLTTTELAQFRNNANPLSIIMNALQGFSEKREAVNRVAYAASLLREQQVGRGGELVKAHDWIDTEGLEEIPALGKIARDVEVDYKWVSKSWARYVSGLAAPFGTWYFKMSVNIWRWMLKHWGKALMVMFAAPVASTIYNDRNKETRELEKSLPDSMRNRVHFILGKKPDGKTRVLSLQLPQDALIGTKIFTIATAYANRVVLGEMGAEEAAIKALKEWGYRETAGTVSLMAPIGRFIYGLASADRRDPYDKTPIYSKDPKELTAWERRKQTALFGIKVMTPFLSASISAAEKGLPQDMAWKQSLDTLVGLRALGIYDVTPQNEVVVELEDGKKIKLSWDDNAKIEWVYQQEGHILDHFEDAFVASGLPPDEFYKTAAAQKQLLAVHELWSKFAPELNKGTSDKEKEEFVIGQLGARLVNRIFSAGTLSKWYQVRLARAKTAEETTQLSTEYNNLMKFKIEETIKKQPKTSRQAYMAIKLADSNAPVELLWRMP
jgi:hypothetical protein